MEEIIKKDLSILTDKEKEAFLLRQQGLSLTEIGKKMGISYSAARADVRRAERRLRGNQKFIKQYNQPVTLSLNYGEVYIIEHALNYYAANSRNLRKCFSWSMRNSITVDDIDLIIKKCKGDTKSTQAQTEEKIESEVQSDIQLSQLRSEKIMSKSDFNCFVGDRVRTLRQLYNIPSELVAKEIDTKRTTYCEWEGGRKGMPANVMKYIANKIFGITLDDLLDPKIPIENLYKPNFFPSVSQNGREKLPHEIKE